MKRSVFVFTLFQLLVFALPGLAQGYKIDVTIDGYTGEKAYLGYRRADKVYSKDTVAVTNGKYVFEGPEPLPAGIYLVLMPPDNKFFEFVVTQKEQQFSVMTKAPDFYQNLKVKGSKDNQLLLDYQKYMSDQVAENKKIQEALAAETDDKKKEKLKKQQDDLSKSVRERQNKYIKDNPGTYTAKLIAAFQDPEIPEAPKKADGSIDSSFAFNYYRSHFWDGFDFSDEIFVNTPYLKEKTDKYLDKLTLQSPDSVGAAAEWLVEKSRANEEVFKYLLPYLLNKYYTPEIMGLDAVFIRLSDKYYKSGIADWVTPENLKKITDDAYMNSNVLIGKQAPNVRVQRYDPVQDKFTDELISPYDVKADYTIIFLWKPGCGHCKHMTEELIPFYEEWKNKGVEIFSISSANHTELEEAVKNIHEKKMPWIITADPYTRARALQLYYGTSLPKLYVLDKNKKIIANRVGVKQLPEIIENHRKVTAAGGVNR
jgi:thiol-disulfide isomerase/thioredoxin